MHAPIVGLPGGSRASICPCTARRSLRSRTRTPASTTAVRSPASCSRTRSSRAVEMTPSPPSRPIETRSPRPAAPASTSAACSTLAISETLRQACPLERVRPVRPRHLTAQPRRREDLPRVAEAYRGEPTTQPLHRVEVVGPEQERHRARLVDADPVLAGQRTARVDARLEDRLCQRSSTLRLAVAARVVEHERVKVPVAGVEHVADAQAVLALELRDAA